MHIFAILCVMITKQGPCYGEMGVFIVKYGQDGHKNNPG